MSMKPDETSQLAELQGSLMDIKIWTTSNFLLMNPDKTEAIVRDLQHLRNALSYHLPTLDGIILASSTTARNLGVVLDQDMSFNPT